MPNIKDDDARDVHDLPTFDQFCHEMEGQLDGKAHDKNYNRDGKDGENILYRSVQAMTGGHHHAAGEIVYKVRRYLARGDAEDLVKVAAWAFLAWRHHQLDRRKP